MTPSKQNSMARRRQDEISTLLWLRADSKYFDNALLKMAFGVSTSPINVLDRLKDLLSVLPGLIEEFDNLVVRIEKISIKFFDKSRKDREQVFQSVKDVYR